MTEDKWVQIKDQQVLTSTKFLWGLSKKGNISDSEKSPGDKLFKADIWRKYLPSLVILLCKHELLATARDGIWARKDICGSVAAFVILHFIRFLFPRSLHPLTSQEVSTTSAELNAEHSMAKDWGLTVAVRIAAVGRVVEISSTRIWKGCGF